MRSLTLRRIAEVHDALLTFRSVCHLSETEGGAQWDKKVDEVVKRWVRATTSLDETLLLVAVVCEGETINVCNVLRKVVNNIATKLAMKELNAFNEMSALFEMSLSATRNCIRKELGIVPLPTSPIHEDS